MVEDGASCSAIHRPGNEGPPQQRVKNPSAPRADGWSSDGTARALAGMDKL